MQEWESDGVGELLGVLFVICHAASRDVSEALQLPTKPVLVPPNFLFALPPYSRVDRRPMV